MRERKYVKFKVSMYDDTKFKIIDMKPERDLIHYVWTRVVVLAGKVNLEGELYLSKSIPYTIETLAIEFNRDVDAVKAAFDVLMELEMVELTEDKVYKVINFAKHQNIKVKEKDKLSNKDEEVKNKDNEIKEDSNQKAADGNAKKLISTDKKSEEEVFKSEQNYVKDDKTENEKSEDIGKLNVNNKDISIVNSNSEENKDNIRDNKVKSEQENGIHILSVVKNSDVKNKQKKKDNLFEVVKENVEEDDICGFFDGEYKLDKGERVIQSFSLG